ncbi:TetR/AcrR family transcriptional regulator [Streptomyces sp. TRM66268-LWL]|uniref:TetR/AcrR family transcriptional regulator n=1 Tax=Streptomyces polyasparticus TaxID=2767826 RepID=A0ABR7SSC8_9ACTN|nr:TetR/AcrR family transcriptional regulator [Streptomyces polyasparticus]MBC9718354.1 TetR/AcrR family transcriptional regulator [Streptomyces polyasparticus]
MATSRWTAAPAQSTVPAQVAVPRRRGAVLERAILDAALEQLSTVGWNGLTMEGVAAGAQTGKAAVYRRWPSKEDLVADALEAGMPPLSQPPDTGSVREDLLTLCLAMRDAMYSRPGFALRAVLHECDGSLAERFQSVIFGRVMQPAIEAIREVLCQGVRRGEVRSAAVNDHVCEVIPAMMMYRAKVYGSEWMPAEIARMIDDLIVPLTRPQG